jgi:hypothetical protein
MEVAAVFGSNTLIEDAFFIVDFICVQRIDGLSWMKPFGYLFRFLFVEIDNLTPIST